MGNDTNLIPSIFKFAVFSKITVTPFPQTMLTPWSLVSPVKVILETFSRLTVVSRLWLPARNTNVDPVVRYVVGSCGNMY